MEIILYDASQTREVLSLQIDLKEQGEKTSVKTKILPKLIKILMNSLLIFSTTTLIYLSLPFIFAKIQSAIKQKLASQVNQKTFATIIEEQRLKEKELIQKEKENALEEAKKYNVPIDFSIVIPKISASAKIIPNIHPGDESSYTKALKEGVAHALGTNMPGNKGIIYLFAHSTNSIENISRYNAIFFQLKDLEGGDKIYIFYGGLKYTYQVVDKKIIEASETNWLTNNPFPDEETLILQTCWPPGTSQKRLIILAVRV